MKHIVKLELDEKRYGIPEEVFNYIRQCCNKINELEEENKKLKDPDNYYQYASKSVKTNCEILLKRIDKIKEYIKENEKEYGSLLDNEKVILKIIDGEE